MNIERDKFLTEAIGECCHEYPYGEHCAKCGKLSWDGYDNDFSTPEGFFKLWNWTVKQSWWEKFGDCYYVTPGDGGVTAIQLEYIIHPDRFANVVYQYLLSIQK